MTSSPSAMSAAADDIYASDEEPGPGLRFKSHGEMLSELPIVKRQQMTNGYREGLTKGKSETLQKGFDEGYPLGMLLGQQIGPILGVFEAYLTCPSLDLLQGARQIIARMLRQAKAELTIQSLFEGVTDVKIAEIRAVDDLPPKVLDKISWWLGVCTALRETHADTLWRLENPRSINEAVQSVTRMRLVPHAPFSDIGGVPSGPQPASDWTEETRPVKVSELAPNEPKSTTTPTMFEGVSSKRERFW